MILITIAALAFQPELQPAIEDQEIVVTARRLQRWRGKALANGRGSRCRTTQSTGNGELDQMACDSMRYCMTKLTPKMVSVTDRKVPRNDRERLLAEVNRELERCGAEQHRVRVADWVERRSAKQGE